MKYSFGLEKESNAIERAVENVLNAGYRTADIASKGSTVVGTKEMGRLIHSEIEKL